MPLVDRMGQPIPDQIKEGIPVDKICQMVKICSEKHAMALMKLPYTQLQKMVNIEPSLNTQVYHRCLQYILSYCFSVLCITLRITSPCMTRFWLLINT